MKHITTDEKTYHYDLFIQAINGFGEKLNCFIAKLNRSQKFYFGGMILLVLTILASVLGPPIEAIILFFFYLFLLLCGLTSDLLFLFSWLWKFHLGKWLIAILYGMGANFAFAFASQVLNIIVEYETSRFIYTLGFLVILLIPFFIIVVSFVAVFLIIIIGPIYIFSSFLAGSIIEEKNQRLKFESFSFTSSLVRIASIISLAGFIQGFGLASMKHYEPVVFNITKWFIYYFEAQPYSRCQLPKNSKGVFINDKTIVIVSKKENEYIIKPIPCSPTSLQHSD